MSSKTFSVIDVVKESCVSIWGNRQDWLKIAFLPLALYFVFSMLHLWLADPALQWPGTLLGLAFSFIFTVRGCRYVVLGEMPRAWLEWNKIHWKMALYTLLLFAAWILFMVLGVWVVTFVAMILYAIGAGILYFGWQSEFLLQSWQMMSWAVGAFLVLGSLYLYGRVTLAYAALSLERAHPLADGWNKTKGLNAFKLLGALALITLPFLAISALMLLLFDTWSDVSYMFNQALLDPENAEETIDLIMAEMRPRIILRSLVSLPLSFAFFILLTQLTTLVYKKLD